MKQYIVYFGKDTVSEHEREKITNYPGLEIIEEKTVPRYMVLFDHKRELSREELGLSPEFILSMSRTYKLC